MKTENAEQNISEFFVERVQLFDSSLLGEAGQGMAVAGLQNTDFCLQILVCKTLSYLYLAWLKYHPCMARLIHSKKINQNLVYQIAFYKQDFEIPLQMKKKNSFMQS